MADFKDMILQKVSRSEKSICGRCSHRLVCRALDNQPCFECNQFTEEAVHGRWISHNKGQNNWVECSECNTVGSPFWKRCPMCEAKMDGGAEDG